MKFLSLLFLALPMAAQAAVLCCEDSACNDCQGPNGVLKSECMDLGKPAFIISHPTDGDQCMEIAPVPEAQQGIEVDCCYDTKCDACEFLGTTPEACILDGFPSYYDIHLPGDPEENCVRTANEALVDCCTGINEVFPVNQGPECPGTYCQCDGCAGNTRKPLSYCIAEGFPYFAEYYHNPRCRSTASEMNGDPHVKTWAGKWFDYHGECDLVMMHVAQYENKGEFSIHARTKIRTDYSYISNAVLRIGSETLEVASWGDYSINGVGGGIPESRQTETTIGEIAGFKIYHSHPNEKQHSFKIYLGVDESVEFATFKDLVSIRFQGGSSDHFGTTRGLMGDFYGRKLGRDGKTIFEDINAFGQEWQVQPEEGMLFVSEPAPGQCRLPNITAEEKRRLRNAVGQETAEKACAAFKGDAFQACVLDVQLTGDVAIATAGGY